MAESSAILATNSAASWRPWGRRAGRGSASETRWQARTRARVPVRRRPASRLPAPAPALAVARRLAAARRERSATGRAAWLRPARRAVRARLLPHRQRHRPRARPLAASRALPALPVPRRPQLPPAHQRAAIRLAHRVPRRAPPAPPPQARLPALQAPPRPPAPRRSAGPAARAQTDPVRRRPRAPRPAPHRRPVRWWRATGPASGTPRGSACLRPARPRTARR